MQECLIDVQRLTVQYAEGGSRSPVISAVSFSITEGTALALVGGSGSGKTTLCRSLTRLFPPHHRAEISGSVLFESADLLTCGNSELADIRQKSIRYVFQEPYSALNPVATVERQLMLARGERHPTREEIIQLLADVGLPQPQQVLPRYPHELSVGMAQRVMIAMALLPQPSLLIADEPTSAVDASLRKQLVKLLRSIQRKRRMAMILVTHDLAVAHHFADEVAVLQDGALIEKARVEDFFRSPQHQYSQLLLNAINQRTRYLNLRRAAHA